MTFNGFKFLSVLLIVMAGTVEAAEWRPIPEARKGVFYDADGVIKLKGAYQITERMYVEPEKLKIWSNLAQTPLTPGAFVDFTFVLNCSDRRAYQLYVKYYGANGQEVAHEDTREKAPSSSVDRANFSDQPHDTLGLYNHLCTSKTGRR